ncbi:hypothetical protein BC834DRAFT_847743, partial [Gloeopeniophorella convolvens]
APEKLEFSGKTWTVDDMLAGKYKPSEQSERQNAVGFLTRRQERLASAFRHLMTHGQEFDSTNDYRQGFFKDVIHGANMMCQLSPGDLLCKVKHGNIHILVVIFSMNF